MKSKVTYIEPKKAKKINEILAAEREFAEAEKKSNSKKQNKASSRTK